jgi:hypothetical protein
LALLKYGELTTLVLAPVHSSMLNFPAQNGSGIGLRFSSIPGTATVTPFVAAVSRRLGILSGWMSRPVSRIWDPIQATYGMSAVWGSGYPETSFSLALAAAVRPMVATIATSKMPTKLRKRILIASPYSLVSKWNFCLATVIGRNGDSWPCPCGRR